jgi:tRNA(fMet)-specific endonuclease VapC
MAHLRRIPAAELFTSALCVTELRYGAARHPSGAQLWERIARELLPRVQILPLGFEEASRAGDLLADLESKGTPIGIEDVLIAATALVNGLTAATRNVRHFSRIEGLAVESWWE